MKEAPAVSSIDSIEDSVVPRGVQKQASSVDSVLADRDQWHAVRSADHREALSVH
jgi:uncharacterized protein (UPF0147 family)